MKFLDELKKVLISDERFVGEADQIIKTKVSDAARANDEKLLKSLLNDDLLKEAFFTKVDNIYVFDKNKFVWILESKEFLPDSFTMYKNKIGLVDSNNNLISQKQDISLVWPYKDCVLEGGQTKEDQKRDEIFYNETLAPDQVNRLLAPKVLGNAKRYTKEGIEENIKFKEDDNLIIKGNNLLALSSLLERFEGEVNSIIIDPPYYFNNNKKTDAFLYNSSFKLSTWLTFMKDRLNISRQLLSDNGIISIIIGEDGYSHLKLLCDDIFEKENYIMTISWRKSDNQSNIGEYANVKDYILLYKKTSSSKLRKLPLSNKAKKEYSYIDDKGKYRRSNIMDKTRGHYEYDIITPNGSKLKGPWMISKKEYEELIVKDAIHWPERGEQIPYGKTYLSEQLDKGQIPSDFWDSSYGTNQRGSEEMKALFNNRAFDFPKPELLLMNLISISSKENDIVLDFFMGSATTQAVAMKMNRRFIGVEQMDYINTVSVPRLQKIIDGEQGGISKSLNWQGGGSFVYCELLEDNENLVNELEDAKNSDSVKEILNKAIDNGKLIPSVLPRDIKESEDDFDKLSLDEQKNLVMELLNKNQLYVNLSDIDDEDYKVSEADKVFTRSFYGKE